MATENTHRHDRERQRGSSTRWREQTAAFSRRYARELFRSKGVLFWTIAFPAGFYLLAIALFVPEGVPDGQEGQIRAGMAISYGMFGAIIAALNSFSEQLGTDIEHDRYLQFRALSIAPTADLAGRMIAGTVLTVVAFVSVLMVSLPTGASYSLTSALSPVVVFLALVTFAVFWMTLAIAVSLAVTDSRYASIITVSVALVAYMLTGYNGVDTSIYHGPDVLLNVMPHTLSTRLLVDQFVGSSGGGLTPPAVPTTGVGLTVLSAIALVSLAVAVVLMRRYLYRREVMP